jgi:hypothetical protein
MRIGVKRQLAVVTVDSDIVGGTVKNAAHLSQMPNMLICCRLSSHELQNDVDGESSKMYYTQ